MPSQLAQLWSCARALHLDLELSALGLRVSCRTATALRPITKIPPLLLRDRIPSAHNKRHCGLGDLIVANTQNKQSISVVRLCEFFKNHQFQLLKYFRSREPLVPILCKKLRIKKLLILVISKNLNKLWFSWKNHGSFMANFFQFLWEPWLCIANKSLFLESWLWRLRSALRTSGVCAYF